MQVNLTENRVDILEVDLNSFTINNKAVFSVTTPKGFLKNITKRDFTTSFSKDSSKMVLVIRKGKSRGVSEFIISSFDWILGTHVQFSFQKEHSSYQYYIHDLKITNDGTVGIIAVSLGKDGWYDAHTYKNNKYDFITAIKDSDCITIPLELDRYEVNQAKLVDVDGLGIAVVGFCADVGSKGVQAIFHQFYSLGELSAPSYWKFSKKFIESCYTPTELKNEQDALPRGDRIGLPSTFLDYCFSPDSNSIFVISQKRALSLYSSTCLWEGKDIYISQLHLNSGSFGNYKVPCETKLINKYCKDMNQQTYHFARTDTNLIFITESGFGYYDIVYNQFNCQTKKTSSQKLFSKYILEEIYLTDGCIISQQKTFQFSKNHSILYLNQRKKIIPGFHSSIDLCSLRYCKVLRLNER